MGPEFKKRINQIIKTGLIEIKDDFKIYWKENPIAKLAPGKDYLKPNFYLMIDEMIEENDQSKLNNYLGGCVKIKKKNRFGVRKCVKKKKLGGCVKRERKKKKMGGRVKKNN